MNSILPKVFVCVMSRRLDDRDIFSHLIILKTIFHQNNIHVKMFIRLANNERRLLIRLAVQCSAGH